MKYRLALKLDLEKKPYVGGGNMAVGWAVLKLKEEQHSGSNLDQAKKLIDKPAEVRVLIYSNADDMIEPMSLEEQEARLAEVMSQLPNGCKVVKVPFDRGNYQSWLLKNKAQDSHQKRAEWLNK